MTRVKSIPLRLLPTALALLLLTVLGTNHFAQRSAASGEVTVGPNLPTVAGTPQFADSGRAFARQGSCSTNVVNCVSVSETAVGEYKTFGFSVPASASIKGIQVQIGGDCGGLGCGATDTVLLQLLDAGESPIGAERTVTLPSSASYAEPTAGGPTDSWGLMTTGPTANLTPSVVNDLNFGVEITDGGGAGGFRLDYVRITVTYDEDNDDDAICNVGGPFTGCQAGPEGFDNCVDTANGPNQAGIRGVGNQTNTDLALRNAGAKMGSGTPPPLLPLDSPTSLGDACDPDDDNDSVGSFERDPGPAATTCPPGALPFWADCVEDYLRTNPFDNCYGTPSFGALRDAEDPLITNDAWPLDLNSSKSITQADTDFFSAMGINVPADTPLRRRMDLNGDGQLSISDVFLGGQNGFTCE